MAFMTSIITWLNDASDWFYEAYLEAYGWASPFDYIAGPLYQLCIIFSRLAWAFSDFSTWVTEISGKVATILSSADIVSLLQKWLTYAENAWSWVRYAAANVTNIVNTWWSSTALTVLSWVNEAKQYAAALVAGVNTVLLPLQSAWDSFKGKIPTLDAVVSWWGNWWGNILPQLGSWWNSRLLDVQGLINSAFTAREGLWAGWQELRAQVVEFFTDPVEFIWDRFTDWFLGPEG